MDTPDRCKLDLVFDAERLKSELMAVEHFGWTRHFVLQNYEGDWSVIPLRGPQGEEHPIRMIYSDPGCSHFVDTPYLLAGSYFKDVLNSFECPLHAVRLMKLTAGSRIKEHTDYDLSAEQGMARLHIPIVTNDKVDFRLNNKRLTMAEGECWYLRLSDPHSVENHGSTDRTHLVIDAVCDDWLMRRIDTQAG